MALPYRLDDPVLGAGFWDPHDVGWNLQADLTPKHRVALFIDAAELDDEADVEGRLAEAREAFQQFRRDAHAIRLRVAAAFVEEMDECFAGPGSGWDAESLAAKLLLREVGLLEEGEVRLVYAGQGELNGTRFNVAFDEQGGIEDLGME
jgi:hypothetical protein